MSRLTHEQIRKNMQANKSTGTMPEVKLAKALFAKGYRYRKNDKTVFGKPDLTFKRIKLALFIDGEFWHGKDWEVKKHDHKTNKEFWWNKIEGNIKRDKIVNTTLKEQGWTVMRFWSKEVTKDLPSCIAKVENVINKLREEQK